MRAPPRVRWAHRRLREFLPRREPAFIVGVVILLLVVAAIGISLNQVLAARATPAAAHPTGDADDPAVALGALEDLVTPTADAPTSAATPPATGVFAHPGILVSAGQLDFVRVQVAAGNQPWASAASKLLRSTYADLDWQPQPRADVDCGYDSTPDNGCTNEWQDALAAYSDALAWSVTQDPRYARTAIRIINAWSGTLQRHTNANAILQAGWSAVPMVQAAEIIRYTYAGWAADDVARATAMFRDVYLPEVQAGAPRSEGNWDLIDLDAAIGIAVFLDDQAAFDHAVALWRARLPAYIYLSSDGGSPVEPAAGVSGSLAGFWHGQTTYVDGLVQETCRDLGHTAWGLDALSEIAQTAYLHGVDLFAEARDRLVAALEFHAGFVLGQAVPSWLCGGTLTGTFAPLDEIAFNHYHNQLGIAMPLTERLIEGNRPQLASHFYAWESLTGPTGAYR